MVVISILNNMADKKLLYSLCSVSAFEFCNARIVSSALLAGRRWCKRDDKFLGKRPTSSLRWGLANDFNGFKTLKELVRDRSGLKAA